MTDRPPAIQTNANLIWNIAELLRGDYKQSDYGKVILPLVVMRRGNGDRARSTHVGRCD